MAKGGTISKIDPNYALFWTTFQKYNCQGVQKVHQIVKYRTIWSHWTGKQEKSIWIQIVCTNAIHFSYEPLSVDMHWVQCDTIWRNLATLANVYKSLANFVSLFLIWQNAEPILANLWHCWANFHCSKWPNIENKSKHLVTPVGLDRSPKYLASFWQSLD